MKDYMGEIRKRKRKREKKRKIFSSIKEMGSTVLIAVIISAVILHFFSVVVVDGIKIQNNKVYVNGEVLDEPYINEPMNKNENITVTIPEGYLFVMGDNRNNSLDSRSSEIGLIDVEKEVVGKAIFSLSSFSKIY